MGLHGRFKAGLTANQIKVLRGNSAMEEEYGVAERVKELVDRLLSTTDGQNLASLMKIADAGSKFTATTLEGVLAELAAGTGIADTGIPYTRADGSKKNIGAGDDTIRAALDKLDDTIAALSGLSTSAKTSVVAAINEIVTTLSGLRWRQSVAVKGLLGRKTIADIDALVAGASKGDSYIAEDAGTPGQGTSTALVAGDITEWDGTQWIKIVSASGGFVPAGTLAIVGSGTLVGTGFTDVTDRNKVASFSGASNAPTLTAPTDADARLVTGAGSVNENRGFVYDSDPAGWNDVLGPTLYALATPAAVGVAAVGTSARLAREDHAHGHGDQSGTTTTQHTAQAIAYPTSDGSKNKIPDAADDVKAALDGLDAAMPVDGITAVAATVDRLENLGAGVATAFSNTITTAANELQDGDELYVEMFAHVVSANGADTFLFTMELDGAAPIIATAAWDASGDDTALLKCRMRVYSSGATGYVTFEGEAIRQIAGGGSAVTKACGHNAAFDTTAIHTFRLKLTNSAQSANNKADFRAKFKTKRNAKAVA